MALRVGLTIYFASLRPSKLVGSTRAFCCGLLKFSKLPVLLDPRCPPSQAFQAAKFYFQVYVVNVSKLPFCIFGSTRGGPSKPKRARQGLGLVEPKLPNGSFPLKIHDQAAWKAGVRQGGPSRPKKVGQGLGLRLAVSAFQAAWPRIHWKFRNCRLAVLVLLGPALAPPSLAC